MRFSAAISSGIGRSGRGAVVALIPVALVAFVAWPVTARAGVSAPTASTESAISVTATTARLTGSIRGRGLVRYLFDVGPTRRLGERTATRSERVHGGRVRVVARLAHLAPDTAYRFRLTVLACAGCRPVTGGDRTFRTAPEPAVVTDTAVGDVGRTNAAFSSALDPEGVLTTYRFQYGTTEHYGASTAVARAGDGRSSRRVSATVDGLVVATTYHFRLVATSRGGRRFGPDRTFTTAGYFQNPVYAGSMPDPDVLDVGNAHSNYWAFGTGPLFPVLHSTNLTDWTGEPTALRTRPAWVVPSGDDWHAWAPNVVQSTQACPGTRSAGCFVMFYVGLSAKYGVNCVATATSTTPGGPYTDRGPLAMPTPTPLGALLGAPLPPSMPVGCGDAFGAGNIDPSVFVSPSGKAYVYVSTDDACVSQSLCVHAPTISVIPLNAGFLTASGSRTPLLAGQAGTWEDIDTVVPTVEGPFMEMRDSTYYLFYSGGSYRSSYAMGYATSQSPTGPFVPSPSSPILRASPTALAPGGGDRFVTGPRGGLWMVAAARLGSLSAARSLWLDAVSWEPASTPTGVQTPVLAPLNTLPQGVQP